MVDARGKCVKCKKKTSVLKPGLICMDCSSVYHGECMVPPMDANELRAAAISPEGWFCKKCFRVRERRMLKMKSYALEKREVKRRIDMVMEIKALLELAEMALDQLMEKHEKLVRMNQALKQENLILTKRLAAQDGGYKLKVDFLQQMMNKKQKTKAEYLENAIKLAQQQGKKENGEEDVTKGN